MIYREQLYAMNIHYRYYDLEYFFEKCQKMQFVNAELWLCPQHFYINSFWSESSDKLKKLMEKYGVKIACLCPEQNNPKPNNIAARSELLIRNTEMYFKRVISLAGEIGCRKVLVTPGWNYHDEKAETARDRSAKMLRRLCDYAGDQGIELVLESIWNKSSEIANTKEKIQILKEAVHRNNLKLTIDLGALGDVGESVQEWFDLFGKDIIHCHFTDGNPTGHMPWGLGQRDMRAVLESFDKNKYKGGFSMEYVDSRSFREPEKWDDQTLKKFEECTEGMGGYAND